MNVALVGCGGMAAHYIGVSLHRAPAVAAIEAGTHVLLQKPVAAKLADAEAIAEAARRSTRTVGLYMSYFDQPLIHDLRDMVRQGWLGDVVKLLCAADAQGRATWPATWRHDVVGRSAGRQAELACLGGRNWRRLLH